MLTEKKNLTVAPSLSPLFLVKLSFWALKLSFWALKKIQQGVWA